jgi:hypothetical protein
MWQPQAEPAYASLQWLGITAGMVKSNRHSKPNKYVTDQISLLTASNLRWYLEDIAIDFYSAYHRPANGRPVNWRFREVKRRYWADPTDMSVFVRDPSLSDPRWLARIRHRLAANVEAFRDYRPLFYNLADEARYRRSVRILGLRFFAAVARDDARLAADPVRHPRPPRRGMGHRFPPLGRSDPMTTDQAIRQRDGNLAAWADFKEWMDVAFARAVKAGTDPAFASSAEWQWGHQKGNFYSQSAGAVPPHLHNWEAMCNPLQNPVCPEVAQDVKNGVFAPGAVGSYTAPWMQYYVLYALGRASELGFR